MDVRGNSCGLYSDIKSEKIDWLWYPYIPFGKITILQGDPGSGKSTLMMDIIGKVTTSGALPNGERITPINVIYQCSEDGLSDTIKPRLEQAKADCNRIGYIKEEMFALSLDDEIIRNSIIDMKARLLVVDPFQAYIGDTDLSSAIGIRRILRRLSMWATATNCAIVLVGHLNKKSGANELYRGLGSIDLVAVARSVIQVENDLNEPEIRIIKHIKSSLAPKGKDSCFTISNEGQLIWLGEKEPAVIADNESESNPYVMTKLENATNMMVELLSRGINEASVIMDKMLEAGYSERTIKAVKKTIAVSSEKRKNKWYWFLPSNGGNNEEV